MTLVVARLLPTRICLIGDTCERTKKLSGNHRRTILWD